jgi:hypothetical protein
MHLKVLTMRRRGHCKPKWDGGCFECKFAHGLDGHSIFDRHEDTRANQNLTGFGGANFRQIREKPSVGVSPLAIAVRYAVRQEGLSPLVRSGHNFGSCIHCFRRSLKRNASRRAAASGVWQCSNSGMHSTTASLLTFPKAACGFTSTDSTFPMTLCWSSPKGAPPRVAITRLPGGMA